MIYTLDQEEIDICDAFAAVYEPYEICSMDMTESPCLPPQRLRICRFCGRSYGATFFENNPHRFSKFLCNPYLIWEEECDECNSCFSEYEKNLAHWLGLHRVFSDIRPGNKRFIFSASDGSVQARRLGQLIYFERTGPDGFQGDVETGQLTITTTPLPYTPAFVYNAFLKNALSALPIRDVESYSPAFVYLRNKNWVRKIVGFRHLWKIETNLTIEHSAAALYKRKIADPQYPLHMFCLYVRNFMFQIALTLDRSSFGRSTVWKFLPAHYLAKSAKGDEPFLFNRTLVDLSSPDEVHPGKEGITLTPNKEDLGKLVAVQMPPDFLEKLKKWNG